MSKVVKNNPREDRFYELMRIGLWADVDRPYDVAPLSASDWNTILSLAANTGTTGIIIDAIEKLPQTERPSQQTLMRLAVTAARLGNTQAKHNIVIDKLTRLLNDLGVKFVLLKGQSNAINYPTPQHRACGDIDVFIGVDQIDKLLAKLKELGITYEDEIDDNEKHATCFIDDIHIEFHRYAAFMDNCKADRFFQKWWADSVSGKLDSIYVSADGRLSKTDDSGSMTQVPVARATANVFFLFYHLYHHFVSHQMSFRQFGDLARFLYKRHEDIDEAELLHVVELTKLVRPWKAFGSFLNAYMGLEAKYIPGFAPSAAALADKMADRLSRKLLSPAKQRPKRPKSRLASKMFTYRLHVLESIDVYKIFPSQSVEFLIHATVQGLKLLTNKANRNDTFENYEARKNSAGEL